MTSNIGPGLYTAIYIYIYIYSSTDIYIYCTLLYTGIGQTGIPVTQITDRPLYLLNYFRRSWDNII